MANPHHDHELEEVIAEHDHLHAEHESHDLHGHNPHEHHHQSVQTQDRPHDAPAPSHTSHTDKVQKTRKKPVKQSGPGSENLLKKIAGDVHSTPLKALMAQRALKRLEKHTQRVEQAAAAAPDELGR